MADGKRLLDSICGRTEPRPSLPSVASLPPVETPEATWSELRRRLEKRKEKKTSKKTSIEEVHLEFSFNTFKLK